MLISKLKNARKHISLLLIVMMLFSMCSVGIPAAAFEETTDNTSTDATPTNKTETPLYYYNDSNDIESQPNDYINGIMIAHYFNIMGAYDGQNNFKPNEPMKSSDVEYALKAIDSGEPTMSNFAGEHLTVQALVHRIWLAAGKGSYIYSAEMQRSYLNDNLGIPYDENNDFANAWTFCVKNGIIKQFLGREDISKNLIVTRAMAAYALSNYYLWREGYDINNLTLDIPNVAPIDEALMRETIPADPDVEGKRCYIGTAYNIGDYTSDNQSYDEILVYIDNEFSVITVDMREELSTMGTVFITLPPFEKILQSPSPAKRTPRNINLSTTISLDLNNDGKFDDYTATAIDVKSALKHGDINENGNIGIDDCLMLQNTLTGIIGNSKRLECIADFNSDGKANLLDAYLIWSSVNSVTANTAHTNVKKSANATTFKFMADGNEILTPIEINANTHYLKLPKNTFEKDNFSFNYWSLYRFDGYGNKLYYCENSDGTGVQWIQNETDEYSKVNFANESFIYNMPTGEFNTLYFDIEWISHEDFEYTLLDDGTVEIKKYKGNSSYVTVPKVIDGYTVTSIGEDAFSYYTNLTSITIPDSVTSIENCAFSGCESLIDVQLPERFDNLDYIIENNRFYNTSWLTNKLNGYNVSYSSNDKSISIAGYKGNETEITIPSSFDGCSYSVTSIGHWAFEDCTSLASITIPDTVTSIGDRTFYNCTSLTSITIPDSVTSIGERTFDGTSWYNIQPDGDVYAGNVYYKYKGTMPSNHTVNIREGTVGIAGYAFYNCKRLASITIPNGVTSIEQGAFRGCTSLKSINIPDSVTYIGEYAFRGCTSLASITIPNSETSIGGGAFSGCTSLTDVQLPEMLNNLDYVIENNRFYSTPWLTNKLNGYNVSYNSNNKSISIAGYRGNETEITIPSSFEGCSYTVTSIGYQAFYNYSSIISVIIPEGVTSIGAYAFSSCTSLTSINIPNGVTNIDIEVFSGCTSLASITIPDSVTSIGYEAFYGCTSLSSITIPNSVTSIGSYAFEGCTSLTSINIPNGVTNIDIEAFSGCTSLASITIPNSVTSIGWGAFCDCTSLTSITIPDSVTSIGDEAFEDCRNLINVQLPEKFNNLDYIIENNRFYNTPYLINKLNGYNVSYNSSDKSISIAGYKGNETEITIPSRFDGCSYSVTSIVHNPFYNYTSLTSITIPNSVKSIGVRAFKDCTRLTSITIPNSVTWIGDYAFSGCTNLKSITIPESVTSIRYKTFYNCTSLTSITIPDTVTSIGRDAFRDCSNLTIYCYANSTAQTYAIDSNIPYTLITETP